MFTRTLRTLAPRRVQLQTTRALSTTTALFNDASSTPKHTTDSYAKDVDTSPAPDSSIHVVDAGSSAASKPHGKNNKGYETVSQTAPYTTESGTGESENALRYGAKEQFGKDKKGETSGEGEGPEGKGSKGREPEK